MHFNSLDPLTYSPLQMIYAYASGSLCDAHFVCGTVANSMMPGACPPHHLYERVGTLLFQVRDKTMLLLQSRRTCTLSVIHLVVFAHD